MVRIVLLLFVLFTATQLSAQAGPGGVGNSSTNVLWLRADDGVYSDAGITKATPGANVQRWADMSGNGRHANQATTGNRPNYTTGVVNGNPVLRFTAGNGDRMLSTGLSTANRASVWVVGRYTSLPSPNPGLIQGGVSGNAYSTAPGDKNMGMWVASSSTQLWGRGIQSDGTIRNVTQATALSSSTPYLLNTIYGASTIDQYVNNGVAGSVTTDGTMRSWTDMAIGCQAGTEYWNGDMAEVIHYNVTVNAAQRVIISNYLAAKYGVSLSSNDVYRQDLPAQGNYDHEVAGIGRIDASNLHTDAQGTGVVRINGATGLGNNEFLMWGHDNGTLGTFGVYDLPTGAVGRWGRVWRVSERNSTGASTVNVGAVNIIFDLTSFNSVDASHLRLLVDTDQDGTFADESMISGAESLGGGQYRFTGVNALTDGVRFTLGTTNPGTPLPVELVSFSGEPSGPDVVALNWKTATESNSSHFDVERSIDLVMWESITSVSAAGTSAMQATYQVTDRDVPNDLLYYRLRQVDIDGTFTFSQSIVVDMQRSVRDEAVAYPNPSNGSFNVLLPEEVNGTLIMDLIDATGRTVPLSPRTLATNRFVLDPGDIPSGVYLLRVHVQGSSSTCVIRIVRE